MVTVQELRIKLVQSGKFTQEEVNKIKSKATLLSLVEECVGEDENEDENNGKNDDEDSDSNDDIDDDTDDDLDDYELGGEGKVDEEDENEYEYDDKDDDDPDGEFSNNENEPKITVPSYSSAEWHDFILSQLRQDEMTPEGLPLVHGLRRLAEEYLGEIISNRPVKTYNGMDGYACEWELVIAWKVDLPEYVDVTHDLPTRVFGAAVDASIDGTPDPFRQHLLATADTKAEAKALRRALNLRVYAAEEIDKQEEESSINLDESALPEQVNLIKVICKRTGIDVSKLLSHFNIEYVDNNLDNLTRGEAAKLNRELHSFTSHLNGEKKEIPTEILTNS